MTKYCVSISLIIFLAAALYATAQFGDILIYKGKEYSILTNPLESFFDKDHPRPDKTFRYLCTACWRGYIATWKIENGKLYLVKAIEGTCDSNAPEIDLEPVLGRKPPVEAVWFSGVLRVPDGRLLEYVHMGYESVYERDILITIEKGRVVKEETRNNRSGK